MKKAPKANPQNSSDDQVAMDDFVDTRVAELTADIQRVQAEFINFKKRSDEEKATLSQYSKAQVVKELLPVVDDLSRSLNHLPDDLKENKWAQGTLKVHDRLQKQLEKLGVTQINPLNQPFDPNLHEAVLVEGEGDHQVVSEVLQPGYKLDSLVIRHAVVKVTNQ